LIFDSSLCQLNQIWSKSYLQFNRFLGPYNCCMCCCTNIFDRVQNHCVIVSCLMYELVESMAPSRMDRISLKYPLIDRLNSDQYTMVTFPFFPVHKFVLFLCIPLLSNHVFSLIYVLNPDQYSNTWFLERTHMYEISPITIISSSQYFLSQLIFRQSFLSLELKVVLFSDLKTGSFSYVE